MHIELFGPDSGALDPAMRARAIDFVESQRTPDGRGALSDQLAVDLRDATPDTVVCVALDGDELVGYAQVSRVHGGALMGIVAPAPLWAELGARVVAAAPARPITWWVFDPDATSDEVAQRLALRPGRRLLQMRVPLPLAASATGDTPGRDAPDREPIRTRSFVDGDAAEWVRVNNAAFAWHPEQGGWTVEDLTSRQREAWWNPDGFRVLERDGRMAGFCWTKIHADTVPPMGEIYVVAVHPDFHRQGLGRALTVDGLDWLARAGLRTGMLYVDADNTGAVELYRRLGFEVHETQQAYSDG